MTARDVVKADWSAFGLADSVVPFLASARERGQSVALVTVFRAIGGGPRGVGAQMAVTLDNVSGYVSGGCVEADVTEHALATLADGEPRNLVYGQGGPLDIRLPCGGSIELLVERLGPDDKSLERLIALTNARRPALWVSDGGTRACYDASGDALSIEKPLIGAYELAANSSDSAGRHDESGAIYRLTEPQARLVVVGQDPTALTVAATAQLSGYEVTLVRPKGPATLPPIAGIAYLRTAAAEAFAKIRLDPWTSVVVATHNDEDDHDALLAALPSSAGYVGLLGSRRRLEGKLSRLRAAGVSENDIARLKAPIGLPIGARSAWEIATSVLAEVVQTAQASRSHPAASISSSAAA